MPFNFSDNKVVSDLSTVPEQFQGLYVEGKDAEQNTVYTVYEGAAGLVEAYTGTNTALDSARTDKKKASDESASRRQALKAVSDFVAELGLEASDDLVETLRAHIGVLSESVKNGKEISIDLEKIKREYETRFTEKDSTHASELAERDSALEKHLIQDVATREIAAAKGAVDLLVPHVRTHCKVVKTENGVYEVRVVDGQGDVRSDGAGGWMGVKELVGELKNTETFGRAFESETPGGTGSPPGGMKKTVTNNQQPEKSAQDKISAGLQKGKAVYGAGSPVQ